MSRLRVVLVRGRNLIAKDRGGTSDPFAVLKCGQVEYRSPTIKKTLEPEWNYAIEYETQPGDLLTIVVRDWNMTGHAEFMGCCQVNLDELPSNGKRLRSWLELSAREGKNDEVSGDIEVVLQRVSGVEGGDSDAADVGVAPPITETAIFEPWLSGEEPVFDPANSFVVEPAAAHRSSVADNWTSVCEELPQETNWFRRFFIGRDYETFGFKLAGSGDPVIVPVLRSFDDLSNRHIYLVMAFDKQGIVRRSTDSDSEIDVATVLARTLPNHKPASKSLVKIRNEVVADNLAKLENDEPSPRLKIGVLYVKEGQTDENEIYSNMHESETFDAFLDLIGERVTLQGFDRYSAQLDTKNGLSGKESVYCGDFRGHEIMLHVSTLLHFDETDEQRIQRKRFIGNDIVNVVFVDGPTTYSVNSMASQYTNIIGVVQSLPDTRDRYKVAWGRKRA